MTVPANVFAWLEEVEGSFEYTDVQDREYRALVKDLLKRPTLPHPDDLTYDLLERMEIAAGRSKQMSMYEAYKVVYDEYTKPKTKMIEKWHLELSDKHCHCTIQVYTYENDAKTALKRIDASCWPLSRVTGPHLHEVLDPAHAK